MDIKVKGDIGDMRKRLIKRANQFTPKKLNKGRNI